MNIESGNPHRIHSLDALRGVAALVVVLFHWQHFFFVGSTVPGEAQLAQMPMYSALRVFYALGWMGVDLFFSLSGFIFFWLYSESIHQRRIGGYKFLVLRFSRLYPLHFITLLAAAAGQHLYGQHQGTSFVYGLNDLHHFLLNLALLPSIGLEQGLSFNGPVWSVSVEIVLYAIFFALCRLLRPRLGVALAIVVFTLLPGIDFYTHTYEPMLRGIRSFFTGGCTYFLFTQLRASRHSQGWARVFSIGTPLLWLVSLAFFVFGIDVDSIPGVWRIPFSEVFLFPSTILCLALSESRGGRWGSKLSFLGDISYSCYLLHFPLQIAFAIAALKLGADPAIFQNPLTLIVFFAVLVLVSHASFRWLEVPVQQYLRRRMLGIGRDSGQAQSQR